MRKPDDTEAARAATRRARVIRKIRSGAFDECTAAAEPPAPAPDPDLTPALAASIERAKARRDGLPCPQHDGYDCFCVPVESKTVEQIKAHDDMKALASALGATFYISGEYCATCGDLIDQNDADNLTRTAGCPRPGRIDCGYCIRLMRKVGTD